MDTSGELARIQRYQATKVSRKSGIIMKVTPCGTVLLADQSQPCLFCPKALASDEGCRNVSHAVDRFVNAVNRPFVK
ncbi:uncharacterized protein BDZ99DRAFT_461751 [Mytilinidion resinicola]|uniref:Uncharacterized protein n=1 Tax=Mytilinidion resinicola TaxID=574789 RepID=A0A6A6YUV9_9PEZI|nr:uncharacterized protein BDZ99DRAFT_461751 [Mytilinidion resinicola]KAF2811755.1 hypothetical protein BDZ99DRAFT_461751 [Mytilinidion resinicola]